MCLCLWLQICYLSRGVRTPGLLVPNLSSLATIYISCGLVSTTESYLEGPPHCPLQPSVQTPCGRNQLRSDFPTVPWWTCDSLEE